MMNAKRMINACQTFTKVAAPYLYIEDEEHYNETLMLIEKLMNIVGDDKHHALNAVIDMLSHAVAQYESYDSDIIKFERAANKASSDLVLLRLLMDQHGLDTTGLPEIGSKSMVSRVLNGERELNKKHIQRLSKRFGIDPGLFFSNLIGR